MQGSEVILTLPKQAVFSFNINKWISTYIVGTMTVNFTCGVKVLTFIFN
jgi:hypothetical protein